MGPKKSSSDPKQPSMLGFVTPSKKRKAPDSNPRHHSPSPKKNRKCTIESNNNNNNNNNVDKRNAKRSDNKENAATVQKNKKRQKSSSDGKTGRGTSTSPKRSRRKAHSELVDVEDTEAEPDQILGIADQRTCYPVEDNGIVDHGDAVDGIIDHGEDIDDDMEVIISQRKKRGKNSLSTNSEAPDIIAEESDDDCSGLINSNGVVELSPTTATVVSPSGSLMESPEFGEGRNVTSMQLPSDTTPERKVQVFKCKKCDQVFRNRYFMRKHMLMDHEHQLYKCRICAFTSVFPEKLKSHIIKQHVCKKEKSEALTVQTLKNENEVFEQQAPRKIIMIDGVPLGKVKKVPQCYICDVCGKVYSSKFSLERHVRCHTGERPYQCEVCEFTTSYREHMQRHMTSVHLVVHSDEPRLKYVPKSKRSIEELEKEVSKMEEQEEETNPDGSPSKQKRRNILRKRFECAACGMRATHKSDLVEHIKEKHPKAHIVSLDNNDGSKVHLVVTASKKAREARKFTATCTYCSKVFHDNWKYMVHLRSHTGVKPFSCSECDFHATTKMTVRDHIHRKHKDCPDAKLILKLVNITDGSVEEVAIDVPQKEFKCEICNDVFPGNYELKTHKFKRHPEAKPFSCTLCDQREWGKASIIIHCCEAHPEFELETIILRNGRPTKIGPINLPKCDTCSKMFPYQSLLYLHQRTHTGERNYGCDSCDFRTDSKKALTRHILKKHLDSNLKVKPKKKSKKADKKITKDIAISTEDIAETEEIVEAMME